MTKRMTREELPHFIAEILRQSRDSFDNDPEVIAKAKRDEVSYDEFAALAIAVTLHQEYAITPLDELN